MADEPEEKKVFDVAKPGKSKPDMGSKPMIVGHRAMAGDPMVKADDAEGDAATTTKDSKDKMAKNPSKLKIEPLSDDLESKDTKAEETKLDKDKEPTEKGELKKEPVLEEPEGSKSTDLEQKNDKKDGKLEPEAIAMEHEENLSRIIHNKKYNVNINETRGGSVKTFVYVFLGLLIAGFVTLFILVDTNTIDTNIDLPFRIFGSEELVSDQKSVIEPEADVITTKDVVSNEYSIKVPKDWKSSRESIADAEYFSDIFTISPSIELKIYSDSGGRGGDCEPNEADTPHETGNLCPTEEVLSAELLDISQETKDSLFDNEGLYLVRTRFTDEQGVSSYHSCIEVVDKLSEIELNRPNMGFFVPGCAAGIAINGSSAYYIYLKVTGVDNSSMDYFEDENTKLIEEAYKTFELRQP